MGKKRNRITNPEPFLASGNDDSKSTISSRKRAKPPKRHQEQQEALLLYLLSFRAVSLLACVYVFLWKYEFCGVCLPFCRLYHLGWAQEFWRRPSFSRRKLRKRRYESKILTINWFFTKNLRLQRMMKRKILMISMGFLRLEANLVDGKRFGSFLIS